MSEQSERSKLNTTWPLVAGPRVLRRAFPQILWLGDSARHEVALTFDDGPQPDDVPALLEVLARHGVTASFCWLGEKAEARPDLVRAAADAGHLIGLHGYRHRPFVLEATEALRGQLAHTREILAAASGRPLSEIRFVRPPYGVFTPPLLGQLIGWGYRPVMGSIVPLHWKQPVALSVEQVTRQARPGSVIVLHEVAGSASVAQVTDAVLTRLKALHYRFVTIDHMWERLPERRKRHA